MAATRWFRSKWADYLQAITCTHKTGDSCQPQELRKPGAVAGKASASGRGSALSSLKSSEVCLHMVG